MRRRCGRVVRQAVRDVRTAPSPPPADPLADPSVAALRRVVADLAASSHAIGELMLEVAPAYLSDSEAAYILALLCEQIGEPLEHGLAARRYAISGDRRALHDTVLCPPPLTETRLLLRVTHTLFSLVGGVCCEAVRCEARACGVDVVLLLVVVLGWQQGGVVLQRSIYMGPRSTRLLHGLAAGPGVVQRVAPVCSAAP